jgi:hypothetical protein
MEVNFGMEILYVKIQKINAAACVQIFTSLHVLQKEENDHLSSHLADAYALLHI